MKVIMVHHPHQFKQSDFPPLAMALGFFDGVHAGHKKVIGTAKEIADAKQMSSAVMTFDPHPSVVLGQEKKRVEYITPLEDKIELIAGLGIEFLFIVRFTSAFANLDTSEFVQDYLIGLNVKHVVAGFDFTYGKFGKGTMKTLPNDGKGFFGVTTIPKLQKDEEKVSSTLIRKLLQEGNVEKMPDLLGRYYMTKGTVVHGEKRGRLLGFPTANIRLDDDYIVPKTGVYAVRLLVGSQWAEGVCNVGYKPTFKAPGEMELSIEVHLNDFNESIYGEEVVLEWLLRIREEKKFPNVDELKAQILKDKQQVVDFFKSTK